MPVFFYVDPQILTDPAMEGLTDITLSYTFFRSGDLEVLDLEDEMRKRQGLDGKDQLQLSQTDKDKIKAWTETMSAKMGVVDKSKPAPAAPAAAAPTSADAPAASTADPA